MILVGIFLVFPAVKECWFRFEKVRGKNETGSHFLDHCVVAVVVLVVVAVYLYLSCFGLTSDMVCCFAGWSNRLSVRNTGLPVR